PDIFHPEVVVTQSQRLFENLVDVNRDALGFVLPRKAEQVLDDAVRALRLFVKLVGVLDTLRADIGTRREQLAVSENSGERVVEFVGDAGNQLANGRHFFAVKQLLLRSAQIVVR